MCKTCGVVLNPFVRRDRKTLEKTSEAWYEHPDWYLEYWPEEHDPEPVFGVAWAAESICDFCSVPNPKWAFLPRKDIILIIGANEINDYSGVWYVCTGCKPFAARGSLSKLLQRQWDSAYGPSAGASLEVKKSTRMTIKPLFEAFINSNPSGPHELKIPPKQKKIGKPSSRKGM